MTAPDKLWVTPESCESRLSWTGLLSFNTDDDGGEGYTRTASIPAPGADYVAGLEAALRMVKSSIENGGGGGVVDVVWCDGEYPETVCDHIAAALSARPATDTRVVTVAQLERVAVLIADISGYADIDDHICDTAVAEIRAIIGGQANE